MNDVMQKISACRIIAICRGIQKNSILSVARALYNGGIRVMELPFRSDAPETWETTGEEIHLLRECFQNKMSIGAGTVTDVKLVQIASQAGAQFIVSPNTDALVMEETKRQNLVSIPGAMTPTEILQAMAQGADFIKIFPAQCLGKDYIQAMVSALPSARLLAFGGITADNACGYLQAGAVGAGVGSAILQKQWLTPENPGQITLAAENFISSVK